MDFTKHCLISMAWKVFLGLYLEKTKELEIKGALKN